MPRHIEVIARGLCLCDGHILLCRSAPQPIAYLPGGHVEFDEPARAALEREILEELGCTARAGLFRGAIEHSFMQRGTLHCELNLVFDLVIDGLHPGRPVTPAETHLGFDWTPLAGLDTTPLEPAVLLRLIPRWASGAGPDWASCGRFEPGPAGA